MNTGTRLCSFVERHRFPRPGRYYGVIPSPGCGDRALLFTEWRLTPAALLTPHSRGLSAVPVVAAYLISGPAPCRHRRPAVLFPNPKGHIRQRPSDGADQLTLSPVRIVSSWSAVPAPIISKGIIWAKQSQCAIHPFPSGGRDY